MLVRGPASDVVLTERARIAKMRLHCVCDKCNKYVMTMRQRDANAVPATTMKLFEQAAAKHIAETPECRGATFQLERDEKLELTAKVAP